MFVRIKLPKEVKKCYKILPYNVDSDYEIVSFNLFIDGKLNTFLLSATVFFL